jgi:hypothetical protein
MTTIKEKAVAAISRPETGIVFGVISLVGLYFKSVAIELKWGACPAFMPAGCALAVLHGDPAKPNADVFLRASPYRLVPRHRTVRAVHRFRICGGCGSGINASKVGPCPGTLLHRTRSRA